MALISWILYGIFIGLYSHVLGYSVFLLSVIPVVMTSAWLGSKYTLVPVVAILFFHFLILYVDRSYQPISGFAFIGGSTVIFVLALVVGKLKDINDKLNGELKRKEKIKEKYRQSRKKIEKLHEIASELETCRDKDEIYKMTLRAAEDIFDLDISEIEVPEDDKMVVRNCSSNFPEKGKDPVPLYDSIAGRAYLNDRSFLINDMDSNEFTNPSCSQYDSGITVPIGDEAVFQSASKEKNAFKKEDVQVVELLANHAAEALKRVEIRNKSEFLHSLLRHDVRNKINVIQGYLSLIDDFELDEEIDEYLEMASGEIESSLNLIEKIRTMKEMGEEKIEAVEIDDALESSIDENISSASTHGIEIKHEKIGCEVKAGPLIVELFSNIIENSIKHSNGSLIRVTGEKTQYKCIVSIEDDGKGIPDEDKESIFGKGYKKGKSAGSGLGMYMVEELANNYEATVNVKDSELGGAHFEVTFEKAK